MPNNFRPMDNNPDHAIDIAVQEIAAAVDFLAHGYVAVVDEARTNTASSQDRIVAWTVLTAARNYQISSEDIAVPGRRFVVKDQSGQAGTFPITISTEGSEKIDGQDSISINANYGAVGLYSDGNNLFII